MLKKIIGLVLVLGLVWLGVSQALAAPAAENTMFSFQDVVVPFGTEVDKAVSVGGSVTVNGKVNGDAVAVGGSLILNNGSEVGGNAVSIMGKVEKAPNAVVKGNVTEIAFPAFVGSSGASVAAGLTLGFIIFKIISFIGFIVLVVLALTFFPSQLALVSTTIDKNLLKTFLYGLLVSVLFVPIIILLAISIVGIPLIPIWTLLVAVGCLFGYIAAAQFIGKKVLKTVKLNKKSVVIEALTGIVLLALVGLVPILGGLVKLIVSLWGLGAVTLTRFGTQKA